MNPNNVIGLAIALIVVLLPLSFASAIAAIISGAAIVTTTLILVIAYQIERLRWEVTLPAAPEPPPDVPVDLSQSRRRLLNRSDLVVLAWSTMAGIIPTGVGAYLHQIQYQPLYPIPKYGALLPTFLAILAAMLYVPFSSTLIDWYYILPRLAGIVREPPCRLWDRSWIRVTRNWYLHRWLVRLLLYILGAAGVGVLLDGGLVTLIANANSYVQATVPIATAALTTLVTVGIAVRLYEAGDWSNPTTAIGRLINRADEIVAGERPPTYYIVDVSSEFIKINRVVAPWLYGGEPFRDDKGDKATTKDVLKAIEAGSGSRPSRFTGCEHLCCGVNFYCDNNWRADRYRS